MFGWLEGMQKSVETMLEVKFGPVGNHTRSHLECLALGKDSIVLSQIWMEKWVLSYTVWHMKCRLHHLTIFKMYVFTQICAEFEEGIPPSQSVFFPGVQLCLQSSALPPVLRCLALPHWLYWAVSLEHMPLRKPPLNYSEPKHSKLCKEQEVKLV